MDGEQQYVAYIDLLGVGDASSDASTAYQDQLHRFRVALCRAVDRDLQGPDRVFAFSDCAFAASPNLQRIGAFLGRLQKMMWEQQVFMKGALSLGEAEAVDFAALPQQRTALVDARQQILKGFWFHNSFVRPALLEKNLKGVAIQVDTSVINPAWLAQRPADKEWLQEHTLTTGCLSSDTATRLTTFRALAIDKEYLASARDILRLGIATRHTSRRASRYYIPLIITWLKSHEYGDLRLDETSRGWVGAPAPFQQLVQNSRVAAEIASWAGGDAVYYALLAKVDEECDAPVADRLADFIAANRKLRGAAESIPDDICSKATRQKVINSRLSFLFQPD